MASANPYRKKLYGPLLDKTFRSAVASFIQREFPQMGGPMIVDLFADRLESIVKAFFPPVSHLHMGQILWFAVAKEEKPSHGKTMARTKLVPVILTLVSHEDIKSRLQGVPLSKITRQIKARLCQETYEQGGVLAEVDIALLTQTCVSVVSKELRSYGEENNCILPYRGTFHDVGRSITHKAEICKKRMVERKSVSQTAQETNHSPEAISRYEINLNRVLFCLEKGLNVKDTSFVTKLSKNLVIEYQHIGQEIEKAKENHGEIDFDDIPF